MPFSPVMGVLQLLLSPCLCILMAWPLCAATGCAPEIVEDAARLNRRQGPDKSISLRILAIGDSITEGHGSTDGNGYRLDLRNDLTESGRSVDFIGTQTNGANNTDNQEEAYGGKNITEITGFVRGDGIFYQYPNLVLIHAGTNDLGTWLPHDGSETFASAPDRLGTLLDYVLCACPDAVVLVAQLVGCGLSLNRTEIFNAAVPGIVAQRSSRGYKVRAVDQANINGTNLADGIHPNDQGYEMMATNWLDAFLALPDDWLEAPRAAATTTTAAVSFTSCSDAPGSTTAGVPVTSGVPNVPSATFTSTTAAPTLTSGAMSRQKELAQQHALPMLFALGPSMAWIILA